MGSKYGAEKRSRCDATYPQNVSEVQLIPALTDPDQRNSHSNRFTYIGYIYYDEVSTV